MSKKNLNEKREKLEKKILIADDDEFILNALRSEIKEKYPRYKILISKEGEDAVEYAKSENPYLMIVKQELPLLTGLEVFEKVRTGKKYPHFILTSECETNMYKNKAKELGIVCCRVCSESIMLFNKIREYLEND